jgi:lipopolysaccharide biosynthesis glycosyltransferase
LDDTVHIAYALDDNYAELTTVSMASVLSNTGGSIHFHVMENRLSARNKGVIGELGARFPHGRWTFHGFRGDTDTLITDTHLTAETYFRFFLPEILPDLERVIYLDGDTVVEDDIRGLWTQELMGKTAGMTVDNINYAIEEKKKLLDLKPEDPYFNGGVMLIDLKKYGKAGFPGRAVGKIAELYAAYKENRIDWFADQEILNLLLRDEILPLSPKYNLQSFYTLYTEPLYSERENYALRDWTTALETPVIIHFAAGVKPSEITRQYIPSLFWERYYTYKALTPYADEENDRTRIAAYREADAKTEYGLLDRDTYIWKWNRWWPLFTELASKLPGLTAKKRLVLWGAGVHIKILMVVLATQNIFPDMIVDGLPENQGKNVFHYTAQNPSLLKGQQDECFVLLSMEQEKAAAAAANILKGYGFREDAYVHAYRPIWDVLNESL